MEEQKLITLTPEQDKAWVFAFNYHLEDGHTDDEADALAYDDIVAEWPELRGFRFNP